MHVVSQEIAPSKICQMIKANKQSSYLSQISQILFVEKKLSCGKIWEIFEKIWEILRKFGKFWEILPQFTRFHVEKN